MHTTPNLFMTRLFSHDELSNNILFNPDRRLRGAASESLLEAALTLIDQAEQRKKARRPADALRLRHTLSVMLANLATAALNRVDPDRFVAIPFSNNSYSGSGLSVKAMTLARDTMLQFELIEGRGGVRRVHEFIEGAAAAARLTRLRATERLRELLEQHGIDHGSIERLTIKAGNVLVDRVSGVSSEPPAEITANDTVLLRVNTVNAKASIDLPIDAWVRVRARWEGAAGKERRERGTAGDVLATELFRSFKYDWSRGGRLYGAWWIGIPSQERPLLTINGEPTVELDYCQLHPSILFARAGVPLDFDLYTLPGYESRSLRELGKETFARLLNGTARQGQHWIGLRTKDLPLLPVELAPTEYMRRFRARLQPITGWLLNGEGLRLQREDSDLALAVLDRMTAASIATLPVHDSFIVQRKHQETLRSAMIDCYRNRFGVDPVIKGGVQD